MKINGVKFIPSSLVTCFVQDIEVRIVELAYEGFVIRVPNELAQIDHITMHFLQPEQSSYHSLVLEEFEIELNKSKQDIEQSFFVQYTVTTKQKDYVLCTRNVIKAYGDYISLKLSGDDGYLSECLTAYPADKDEEFYTVFEEQKKDWFQRIVTADSTIPKQGAYELALAIDNPIRYREYLKFGIEKYQRNLLMENYLLEHPLFQKRADRVYLGNQFCHNLLPTKKVLFEMIEKAVEEGLGITLVFSYLRDEFLEDSKELLSMIADWCKLRNQPIELVVNDWGVVQILRELQRGKEKNLISLNLGVLLNKRRKDPRYRYKHGIRKNVDNLSRNNLNGASFENCIREKWNINRYEYEVCQSLGEQELNFVIPGKHHSLHLPYYQTNTSQYCTLYAKCKTGDRGFQKLARNCPHYCEEKVFLYPKHLKMVGRYNSLFGFEDTCLRNPEMLSSYLANGIDRIVCTLF